MNDTPCDVIQHDGNIPFLHNSSRGTYGRYSKHF